MDDGHGRDKQLLSLSSSDLETTVAGFGPAESPETSRPMGMP